MWDEGNVSWDLDDGVEGVLGRLIRYAVFEIFLNNDNCRF